MTDLYAAGGLLVVAQILGLYGLGSRRADLLFSVCMLVLLAAAFALAGVGVSSVHGL